MERLTNKFRKTGLGQEPYSNEYIIYRKLQEYEDLEEEIGCPVKVIYKALADGVYTEIDTYGKDVGNGLKYFKEIYISINGVELLHNSMFKGIESIGTRQLKDYKKTWWLKSDKSE